ncbi:MULTISPECIES: GNAT family N-acetyltransferase [Glutamicibacter]|uniref:GNAT family N-acetyltransferase n=1 Tax=Glutamicibacter halophytocola TaxID=1933880 RepID=A0A5B8I4S5_9MICC|nr:MULTISPECIES: GNAT family protein [Glutamicibacter]ALG27937.1 amino acid acetyltransferase [Glutamicibacter halophytocola]MBF6671922.1 GNAT family N-acetyltransferase [Glutamicibacter sp. FBE19]NQD41395.1 GNAT family N-acetyltransferase [Glutamicibacter halophytocola]QDY67276.1 GNAT family N-acetyltransferase [Glutamicibacter halophytocola]UUX59452.1 GNAT family N-acetyltransferase [Glutamicibacter halophytocola]
MARLNPVTLRGKYVTLEPLSENHHDGLVDAACDGELWNLWYTAVPRPEEMRSEIQRRLSMQEAGSMLPFTTRLNDPVTGEPGKIIGMTTYCDIDAELPRLEIGYTWNAASVQGTGTNPDSKRLLLAHAFETLECVAVAFSTHWMNMQSRAAIARLGAKQDGVLRSTSRMADGSLRDTVYFSIIASEWPQVRSGLDLRLSKKR